MLMVGKKPDGVLVVRKYVIFFHYSFSKFRIEKFLSLLFEWEALNFAIRRELAHWIDRAFKGHQYRCRSSTYLWS